MIKPMKKIQISLIAVLFCVKVLGQVIYLSSTEDELFKLDINACAYEYITTIQAEVFDITFHPNGNLYGISGNGNFFKVDTITGGVSQVYDFDGQVFNSLTSAGNGLIYTIGNKGRLWSYDIDTDNATYHGEIGYVAAGDLTFYDGQLYAATVASKIVVIDIGNPSNTNVSIDQDVSGDVFGIVSFADDCTDVESYAITNGNSNIYQIDYINNSLNFICQLEVEIGGGASTFEFYASSPLVIENIFMVNPSCSLDNGILAVEAVGGIGELMYSLDGVNFQSSDVFEHLGKGEYTVYIKDKNGCIINAETALQDIPMPEIINIEIEQSICGDDNGQIIVSAIGGIGELEYSIDGINYQTNNVFTNLQTGEFTVSIRDNTDCAVSEVVNVGDREPPLLMLIDLHHANCNENIGYFEVSTTGGAPPFYYSFDGNEFQVNSSFENLGGGDYIVTVRDEDGCQNSILVTIDAHMPPEIGGVEVVGTTCGESNGSCTFNEVAENEDVLFSIDGIKYQESNTFSELAAGTYNLYVQYNVDCISEVSFEIPSSEKVSILEIHVNDADCNIDNGSIQIITEGGNEMKSISINGNDYDSEFMIDDLIAGDYAIQIINEKDCLIDTLLYIKEVDCSIYIANIFSPNNDGVNDIFIIIPDSGFKGEFKSLRVFDRWGGLYYEVQNFKAEDIVWDGTLAGKNAGIGVYTYFLEYIDSAGDLKVIIDDVTLVR